MAQLGKELVEFLLALIELTAARVIHAEERHDAVYDEEAILVAGEAARKEIEQFMLVLQWCKQPSLRRGVGDKPRYFVLERR